MRQEDREEILEEIRNASKLGYAASVSIIDKLMSADWCREDDLLMAYDDLQKPGSDRVTIFLQLPFLVRLPDKWIKIKADYGHPYIRFRHLNRLERQRKDSFLSNSNGQHTRTQVLVSYQLWERKRHRYIPYLEAIKGNQPTIKTDLTSSGILNAERFELDVANELLLQTIRVLRNFIPIYRTTCKDPFAFFEERIENYFMMVKTGRVVIRDFTKSARFRRPLAQEPLDYSAYLPTLEKRLKSNRRPSIYEEYLLEAARQIELGVSNLAIVQVIMILDWFANRIIAEHLFEPMRESLENTPELYELAIERMWETKRDRKIRVGTEEKFLRYLPAIGINLNSKLKGDLRKVIDSRNEIVHRIQTEPIDRAVASDAVDIGMAIIQYCMEILLSLKK